MTLPICNTEAQIAAVKIDMLLIYPTAELHVYKWNSNVMHWVIFNNFEVYIDRYSCCIEDKRALDPKYHKAIYDIPISQLTDILVGL